MINRNWMYKFEIVNKINKDNGETVEEKIKFALLKPNRKLKEDGELFYAKEVSRFAKAGVLPKAAWGTILSNGGGSISEQEREVYGELLLKFRDGSFELQSILIKTESERSNAEKKRADEIMELQSGISYELNQLKVGKEFKVLFDRVEGDYFIGRTEFDSPEVDNEVLIKKSESFVRLGDFERILITSADHYDLYGQVVK